MASRKRWAQRYVQVFHNMLGWDAKVSEKNGDILVRESNGKFWIDCEAETDPEYLNMCAVYATPEGDPATLRAIAQKVNDNTKVTKVQMLDDARVLFTVGMIVAPPDCLPQARHLAAVLPRGRRLMMAGVQQFHTEAELAGITKVSYHEEDEGPEEE